MESRVLDRGLGAAFEAVDTTLDALIDTGIQPVDSRDAITVITELECLGRRMDAARAGLIRSIDDAGFHREDRHASAKVMVRHNGRLSNAEATGRARNAKAIAALPLVAAKWRAGELGTAQVGRIGLVYANRRVRDALIAAESSFVRRALNRDYRSFDAWVTGWVSRMDQDGTCDSAQRSHDNRDAKLTQDFDKAWELLAHGGPLAGAKMLDVFNKFIEAEFKTDWDKAVAQHGEDTCAADLARTDAQRRFDAIAAIFEQAATTEPGGTGPQVVTNIVMDWVTYQRELARLAGQTVDAVRSAHFTSFGQGRNIAGHSANPDDDGYRCSTIDGNPLDPTEATAASLTNHIRRVVIGAHNVVIDAVRFAHFPSFGQGRNIALQDRHVKQQRSASSEALAPSPPASRRCTATGPAATSPHLNAKSTTSPPTQTVQAEPAAAERPPTTGVPHAGDTTEPKNTATPCGAPPTATGTPNAPTAPKSTNPYPARRLCAPS